MLDGFTEWFSQSALWVLFSTGFLSATLLPGGSEASLLVALKLNQYPVYQLVLVATLGNTLGGLTNYWIGLFLPNRTHSEKYGHKALQWIKQYGYITLLFSWLPIVGDPLCLAAGWLRMKFIPCLILIAIGKAIRYCVIAAAFVGF
ncbi:YqaA family protein [Vibrio penaeicida]|uniref:YqaA family protein n=1 Tax=Vibrio penaeicida TaxID=104609 RepID=UPI0027366EAB|nr:YqaA family protein [Vibrio penaeicida]MDP2573774.1 YqaA family protein [Vibrio penaeicida]